MSKKQVVIGLMFSSITIVTEKLAQSVYRELEMFVKMGNCYYKL